MLAPAGHTAPDFTSPRARVERWASAVARALGWSGSPWVGLVLMLLTISACLIRAGGLPDVPGTLARDESRLALAARSILERGIPGAPGGVIYTRGLLPGYLEALAFAVLGISDQSARLPAIIAGTLIVPATYWCARGLIRSWPAATAATIVAFSPPLISLAREAWLYAWLTLWLVLATGWLIRALRDGRTESYACAGLAYTAAVFSHELAALFLPAAALAQLIQLRALGIRKCWPALVAFWLVAVIVTVAALALTAALRAPTAAGGGSEFQSYLRGTMDPRGLSLTMRLIAASHPWLIPISALGLGMLVARRQWRALAWPLIIFILVLLAFNGFFLTRRGHPRDIQVVLPLLAVAASFTAWRTIPFVVCALLDCRLTVSRARILGLAACVVVAISSVDISGIAQSARRLNPAPTWLQAMAEYTDQDIVLSFAPTQTTHYLGKTDFWLRPNGFARYIWAGPPPYRDIYTGAMVIRGVRELDAQVIARNRGRILWVLAQREAPAEQRVAINEILARLRPLLIEEPATGDGTRVLRIQL
ncbi:MAG: ArnT family glycosyltransferase [Chloroflexota bacterium]